MPATLGLMARQPDTRVQPYVTGGLAVAPSLVGHLRQMQGPLAARS